MGSTEVVSNNLNPNFSKSIEVDFDFTNVQKIQFRVVDVDKNIEEPLGHVETTLGHILKSKKSTLTLKLEGKDAGEGEITIIGEEKKINQYIVKWRFSAEHVEKKDFLGFGKSGK